MTTGIYFFHIIGEYIFRSEENTNGSIFQYEIWTRGTFLWGPYFMQHQHQVIASDHSKLILKAKEAGWFWVCRIQVSVLCQNWFIFETLTTYCGVTIWTKLGTIYKTCPSTIILNAFQMSLNIQVALHMTQ